jgi:predicted phosphodiesterase
MKTIKTCSIGDIHGRNNWMNFTHGSPANFKAWKDSVENNTKYEGDALYEQYDKIIFIGDYVDSFDVTNDEMENNLRDIVLFKKTFPDKVVLLIGNHDLQYIEPGQGCSGYRPLMRQIFAEIFYENKDLFQFAYNLPGSGCFWTHAGITQDWLEHFQETVMNPKGRFYEVYKELEDTSASLEEKLNTAWKHRLKVLFTVDSDSGGHDKYAGPLWVRPNRLDEDTLIGYVQIVGHTHQDAIKENEYVAYIDVLGGKNPAAYYRDFDIES